MTKELEAIRSLLASQPRPTGWPQRRRRMEEICTRWPPAADIRLQPADLDGVPGEWSLAPGADDSRVLLYFHGGGYCSGSIASHRGLVTEAGRAAGVRGLAVGYRLAPENPFPAALEDAMTAWRYLRRLGVAPHRIAVGGDSAGGGLCLALLGRPREASEPGPACTWLISPWTDLTLSGEMLATKDEVDPLIHAAYLAELARAYLPAGMDRRDPRVSPLFAEFGSLPPILIQVGGNETLLADSTRLAAAAGAANVAVTLEIWPDMIHAWHLWNAGLAAGGQALRRAGAFVRDHFRGGDVARGC